MFVKISGGGAASNKKEKQADLAECPKYALMNNMAIYYKYYITKMIAKPVSQLLSGHLEKLPGFDVNNIDFEELEQKKEEKLRSENKSEVEIEDKVASYIIDERIKQVEKLLFK